VISYRKQSQAFGHNYQEGTMAFIETAKLFIVQLFCAMDRNDEPIKVMTAQEFLQQPAPAEAH